MTTPLFAELGLCEPLLRAVAERGYDAPTPIQRGAIPPLLTGRDLLGIAQTGTGKTAAFALPILDYLDDVRKPRRRSRPRVLVLTPTRELAAQVTQSFDDYGCHLDVRHAVIFGGVGQAKQVRALEQGVDVLVATPGRLLDLLDQGHVRLDAIETFVLDEADRMLDMGFLPAVRRVVRLLPEKRQSVLFSATMPNDIVALAHSLLFEPLRVEITPPASTTERIAQRVLLVEKADKRALLGEVLRDPQIERALVFTRTKHGADRVVRHLRQLHESADAIHGDKSQRAREKALERFRAGSVRVLVATDIAARGIDVRDVTHVINFDLPHVPESYVHRIGRTARAGREGIALSFCDVAERAYLQAIERAIGQEIAIDETHEYRSNVPFERERRRSAPERRTPARGVAGRKAARQRQRPGEGRRRQRGRREAMAR